MFLMCALVDCLGMYACVFSIYAKEVRDMTRLDEIDYLANPS